MPTKRFTPSLKTIACTAVLVSVAGCSMFGKRSTNTPYNTHSEKGVHHITDEVKAVSGYSMFVSYDEPDTIAQKHNASIAKKANRLCRNGYDEINRSEPKASKRSTDLPIGGYIARGAVPFSTVNVTVRCR